MLGHKGLHRSCLAKQHNTNTFLCASPLQCSVITVIVINNYTLQRMVSLDSFCMSWGTPLTSNCNVSCHTGAMVLYCTAVRFSWLPTITIQYGSDFPVGSITERFRPSTTAEEKLQLKMNHEFLNHLHVTAKI